MKYKYNGQWVDINIKALDSMVIGSIIQYIGTTIPTGWLECNGATITQSDYPELYNLIGGTLPDFRGRVLVGQDTNDTNFDTLLETGGSKTDNLSNAYAKVGRSNADYNVLQYKSKGGVSDTFDRKLTISGGTIGGSSNTITDATELGGSVSTLQPYAVVKHIIKATNTTPTMASIVNDYSTSTQDGYSCDYVNKNNTYSTSEIKTNKVWVNGKSIYRKVVEKTVNATSNWTSYTLASLGISNYQYIYFGNGCRRIQGDRYVKDVNTDQNVYLDMNKGTVDIGPDSQYKNIYTFVFEYTKTTD